MKESVNIMNFENAYMQYITLDIKMKACRKEGFILAAKAYSKGGSVELEYSKYLNDVIKPMEKQVEELRVRLRQNMESIYPKDKSAVEGWLKTEIRSFIDNEIQILQFSKNFLEVYNSYQYRFSFIIEHIKNIKTNELHILYELYLLYAAFENLEDEYVVIYVISELLHYASNLDDSIYLVQNCIKAFYRLGLEDNTILYNLLVIPQSFKSKNKKKIDDWLKKSGYPIERE